MKKFLAFAIVLFCSSFFVEPAYSQQVNCAQIQADIQATQIEINSIQGDIILLEQQIQENLMRVSEISILIFTLSLNGMPVPQYMYDLLATLMELRSMLLQLKDELEIELLGLQINLIELQTLFNNNC